MFWKKPQLVIEIKTGEIIARSLTNNKTCSIPCDGLNHPRTLMGDFFNVAQCMTEVLRQLAPKRVFRRGPEVYIQLLNKLDGGVTNVEARAFREAASMAGASVVHLPKVMTSLSDEQLINHAFNNWDDT